RQPLEEQDALDQPIGVTHLVERLLVLVLRELRDAPVAQHARMQEVLVDRGELVVEHLVQHRHYVVVAFHARSLLPSTLKGYHSAVSPALRAPLTGKG